MRQLSAGQSFAWVASEPPIPDPVAPPIPPELPVSPIPPDIPSGPFPDPAPEP